jgi:tetratricopeptide (TPR) repeat protein
VPGPDDPIARALTLLNGRSYEAAAAALRNVLQQDPKHADANQLLGLALKNLGQLDEARAAMALSLQANPNQPHVHNNLGGVYLRLNDAQAARASFEAAIQLKSDYRDAWRNLALAHRRLNDLDAAEHAARQAVQLDPNSGPCLETLGQMLVDNGKSDAAIPVLTRASELNPNSFWAWHHLGAALRAELHFPEAMRALETSLRINPRSAESHGLLGAVQQSLGDEAGALASFKRAIQISPDYEQAHVALNHILYRAGDTDSFLQSYMEAEKTHPNAVDLRCGHAQALIFLDRFEEAETVLREAAERAPGNLRVGQLLGTALLGLHRYDEAVAHFEPYVRAAPRAPAARISMARALIGVGEFTAALQHLKACDPDIAYAAELEQGVLALSFICAKQLGLPEARVLYDYERFVRALEILTPPGFASIDAFNAALAEHLESLHTSAQEPIEQTLRGGTQTLGRLFHSEHELIQKLRDALAQTVTRYMSELPDLGAHPLQRRRPETCQFAGSWSVRLRGGGFHRNHYHAHGWLSSAYYVALPREVSADSKAGWLKFGQPQSLPGADQPPEHWIKPEPGTLALFPSYMWHGTERFESGQTRLTVAFDVQSRNPTRRQLGVL